MTQAAFFHADSNAVRFWVEIEGHPVGASISRDALHYALRPDGRNEDPMETFNAHTARLDAAVRRRVAGGSIEPVMLREHDLRSGA